MTTADMWSSLPPTDGEGEMQQLDGDRKRDRPIKGTKDAFNSNIR